jgi:hypothetical protein
MRFGNEITHALLYELTEAQEVTAPSPRRWATAQQNLAKGIDVAESQDAGAGVGAGGPRVLMPWWMLRVVCAVKVLGHPSECSF